MIFTSYIKLLWEADYRMLRVNLFLGIARVPPHCNLRPVANFGSSDRTNPLGLESELFSVETPEASRVLILAIPCQFLIIVDGLNPLA